MSEAEYNRHWLKRVRANAIRCDGGCLISLAVDQSTGGYPQANYRTKTVRIHRQLYKIVHEWELTADVDVCHKCDNRRCIEITHLWAGTRKQNMQDCSQKGRACEQWKTHCDRGHPLSGDNLYIGKKYGYRHCKTCSRAKQRLRLGWPKELAYSMPPCPLGHRPVNPRRAKAAA